MDSPCYTLLDNWDKPRPKDVDQLMIQEGKSYEYDGTRKDCRQLLANEHGKFSHLKGLYVNLKKKYHVLY